MARRDDPKGLVAIPPGPCPYRSLWAAVALLSIGDHLSGRDRVWLYTDDAALVLTLAGFDPDAVRARLSADRPRRAA